MLLDSLTVIYVKVEIALTWQFPDSILSLLLLFIPFVPLAFHFLISKAKKMNSILSGSPPILNILGDWKCPFVDSESTYTFTFILNLSSESQFLFQFLLICLNVSKLNRVPVNEEIITQVSSHLGDMLEKQTSSPSSQGCKARIKQFQSASSAAFSHNPEYHIL